MLQKNLSGFSYMKLFKNICDLKMSNMKKFDFLICIKKTLFCLIQEDEELLDNYQNFILEIIKFGLINKLYKKVEILK